MVLQFEDGVGFGLSRTILMTGARCSRPGQLYVTHGSARSRRSVAATMSALNLAPCVSPVLLTSLAEREPFRRGRW